MKIFAFFTVFIFNKQALQVHINYFIYTFFTSVSIEFREWKKNSIKINITIGRMNWMRTRWQFQFKFSFQIWHWHITLHTKTIGTCARLTPPFLWFSCQQNHINRHRKKTGNEKKSTSTSNGINMSSVTLFVFFSLFAKPYFVHFFLFATLKELIWLNKQFINFSKHYCNVIDVETIAFFQFRTELDQTRFSLFHLLFLYFILHSNFEKK